MVKLTLFRQRSPMASWTANLLLCGLGGLMVLLQTGCSGCGSNSQPPNAKPAVPKSEPLTPGTSTGYREDEKILLRLVTTDILELERNKDYGKIYEEYTSHQFKKKTSRRNFLRMGNCLEHTLGELMDYQRDHWVFTRYKSTKATYDSTTRGILRADGNLKEQITYVQEGVDFKLNSIYWSSTRTDFLSCMKAIEGDIGKPVVAPVDLTNTDAPKTGMPLAGQAAGVVKTNVSTTVTPPAAKKLLDLAKEGPPVDDH